MTSELKALPISGLEVRDIEKLLEDTKYSGYPIVDVIYSTTGSYAATCVLISFLIVLLFFSAVSTVASSSRQIWSFARDHVSLTIDATMTEHD